MRPRTLLPGEPTVRSLRAVADEVPGPLQFLEGGADGVLAFAAFALGESLGGELPVVGVGQHRDEEPEGPAGEAVIAADVVPDHEEVRFGGRPFG